MDYKCLTKVIKDENGQEFIVCSLYGTEKCQIHSCDNCGNCPMYAVQLNQLYAFEQAIIGA